MTTPMSEAERTRLFGEPGEYQRGSIDRMNRLRRPASPESVGYKRGWYARLHGQVHHESADYKEILPVLDALLGQWRTHSKKRGWPKPDRLPL